MQARVPPLIARLTAAIADEHVVSRRDRLRARLAAEYARREALADAEALVADLRRTWQHSGDVRVVPSLNFADACLDRAAGRGEASLAKFRRAHALARAGRQASLAALAAAWVGHALWNREDVDGAAAFLAEAIETVGASGAMSPRATVSTDPLDDHAALARACATAAEMLLVSRRADRAVPWFRHARLHAAALGDDVSFVHLAHDTAVVEVLLMRQSVLTGEPSAGDARAAELHAGTADAAARLFGMAPMPIGRLLEAQSLSLRGDAAAALALYRGPLATLVDVGAERSRAAWLADEAWCEARLGRLEAARATAARARASLTPGTQRDDRAAVQSRLARVHAALGEADAAREAERQAQALWSDYAAWQDRCAARIGALAPPPLPAARGFAPRAVPSAETVDRA